VSVAVIAELVPTAYPVRTLPVTTVDAIAVTVVPAAIVASPVIAGILAAGTVPAIRSEADPEVAIAARPPTLEAVIAAQVLSPRKNVVALAVPEPSLAVAIVPVVILDASRTGISAATKSLNDGVPALALGAAKTVFAACEALLSCLAEI
jgi:hypothetical protein